MDSRKKFEEMNEDKFETQEEKDINRLANCFPHQPRRGRIIPYPKSNINTTSAGNNMSFDYKMDLPPMPSSEDYGQDMLDRWVRSLTGETLVEQMANREKMQNIFNKNAKALAGGSQAEQITNAKLNYEDNKDNWRTYLDTRLENKREGKKESSNKVDYTELDWDFIDAMALRMKNESKYPKNNWKKPIDIIELIKPIIRHGRKAIQPIPGDEETLHDHLVALALNSMMAAYQLKNYK